MPTPIITQAVLDAPADATGDSFDKIDAWMRTHNITLTTPAYRALAHMLDRHVEPLKAGQAPGLNLLRKANSR